MDSSIISLSMLAFVNEDHFFWNHKKRVKDGVDLRFGIKHPLLPNMVLWGGGGGKKSPFVANLTPKNGPITLSIHLQGRNLWAIDTTPKNKFPFVVIVDMTKKTARFRVLWCLGQSMHPTWRWKHTQTFSLMFRSIHDPTWRWKRT